MNDKQYTYVLGELVKQAREIKWLWRAIYALAVGAIIFVIVWI